MVYQTSLHLFYLLRIRAIHCVKNLFYEQVGHKILGFNGIGFFGGGTLVLSLFWVGAFFLLLCGPLGVRCIRPQSLSDFVASWNTGTDVRFLVSGVRRFWRGFFWLGGGWDRWCWWFIENLYVQVLSSRVLVLDKSDALPHIILLLNTLLLL